MITRDYVTVYTPIRVNNGDGTFKEELSSSSSYIAPASFRMHDDKIEILIDAHYPVKVGDVILTEDGAYYRIAGLLRAMGSLWKRAMVERIEKPIVPKREGA